jgi:dienelactone hydrolase
LPNIATNSCRQAQVATGLHPVVVFTPGYTGMLTDETFLFEDLASRGYVVVSVAHPYETVAVEFPDGRLVTSLVGSYLGGGSSLQADEQSVRSARAVRLADLKFLLGEVQRLSATADSPFSGKLDLSRIGVMGHSLGGDVALVSLQRDVRLRAGVWIDGLISEDLAQGTSKPVLLLAAGREQWSADECQLWARLRGPRTAINLLGAEHLTLSDAAWLTQSVPQLAVASGELGREQTLAAVREYVAAFFDQSLRGRSAGTLATGRPSAAVRVTRQDESLCSFAVGLH